ncbi:MAG: Nif3-like dinuclear metal center hexameric protein [Bacteroidaceae bacterium]|nr:Nif3-like dinuclear metal center hexameric protein [Bacteroidaceae bacterium]
MKIKEVLNALERFAPLPLQDSYDNAGMQVGLTDAEVSGVLLCLDVTEAVVDEAQRLGFNLIVSHHPLIFRGLKRITGATYVERCLMKAIRLGIAVFSAHTNLDNAPGGVSWKMAEKLGLQGVKVLQAAPADPDGETGAGVIGVLPEAMPRAAFLAKVKETFGAGCVLHNEPSEGPEAIGKVALCGGAGSFLAEEAEAQGADAFVTGEIKYHDFFGHEGILLAAIGHFESERFTTELFTKIMGEAFPGLPVAVTTAETNPIKYM